MMKIRYYITFLSFIVVCCWHAGLYAQIETGWLQGKVRDRISGAAIGDVEVVIFDAAGMEILRTKTDDSGEFLVAGIPSGEYELRFRKPAFPEYITQARVRAGCAGTISGQMETRQSQAQSTAAAQWQSAPELWSCILDRFDRTRMDRFPIARNIWNLLETQHLSSVPSNIDEGGFQTGIIQLLGVHGATWTQNGYRWDGMNITNPYEPGKPLTYPMLGTLEEMNAVSTFHSAEISAAGADFEMISRRSPEKFHGQAEAYYLGKPFESSNLDSRLRSFGFQTTPHFKRFPEGEFSLGGPVRGPQWSYFASFGLQHLSKMIPDFAVVPTTTVSSALARLDGTLNAKNQVTGIISGQIVKNSHLDARPGIDPSATLLGNDRFELLQGHWVHRHSDRSIAELSFGFSHSSPTDTLQHGVTTPSYTRLFTGEITGSAPLESDSALSRFSLLGQTQTFRTNGNRWSQQLLAGFDLEESLATEERRMFNGLQLFLFPGTAPAEVAEFNTPSHAMQRLRELSFFAQDGLQVVNKIFLRAGFNLDSSNAFLPKQVSGAGTFAPVRTFAGADHVVSWTSISPRAKIVVPLNTRFGDTRIIAGYSRYYHLLPASYADFANPTALGGALYRWNDRDQDGAFQKGEEGTLLRVFGGPYSSVDPNLKRPFTDEWGLAVEHDFSRSVRMGIRLLERDSKRLIHTVNVGVPASAYTPVTVLDPGDDGIPGTRDDRPLTVFNQDVRTFGEDRYLLSNPAGLRAEYKGVEANVTAGFARGDLLSISFNAYKSAGNGNPGNSVFENDAGVIGTLFDNPNTIINSRGRLFFDRAYVAKVAAIKQIPFGIHLSSIVTYFDGLPFGRKLIVSGLNQNQGPIFVMATPRGQPGGFRTQFNMNFDQRVSRDFQLRSMRMTLMLDIFNLLNLNKSLREFDITGPLFAQQKPVDVENPRAFRFGARFSF